MLGIDAVPDDKAERAAYRLTPDQRRKGEALVRLAALILFTFPGSPTVYYGDEVGMEGFEDPLNRGPYPWGHENAKVKAWFSQLGELRRQYAPLQRGELRWLHAMGPILAFARDHQGQTLVTVTNASPQAHTVTLPIPHHMKDLLSGKSFFAAEGQLKLDLPPRSGLLLQ